MSEGPASAKALAMGVLSEFREMEEVQDTADHQVDPDVTLRGLGSPWEG